MASDPETTTTGKRPVTAEEVCAFLRDHPDFLQRNGELLNQMMPPSVDRGGGVVDLQRHMVERLRTEVDRLKEERRELIGTTRANMNSQNRVHAAVLFLLDAQSFEQLIQTITTDLAVLLDLDVVSLIIESDESERPEVAKSGVRVVPPGRVESWLGHRDISLHGDMIGDSEIYGAAAGMVRSEALIRLRVSSVAPPGVLAFGSREPDSFHDGQATELVTFLARVVERIIRSWLDLPI